MPTIGPATITYDRDEVEQIVRGEINYNGIAPTSKVLVTEWDEASRSLIQIDRLTGATVTETDSGATVQGTSTTAGRKVKLTVERTRKCC